MADRKESLFRRERSERLRAAVKAARSAAKRVRDAITPPSDPRLSQYEALLREALLSPVSADMERLVCLACEIGRGDRGLWGDLGDMAAHLALSNDEDPPADGSAGNPPTTAAGGTVAGESEP